MMNRRTSLQYISALLLLSGMSFATAAQADVTFDASIMNVSQQKYLCADPVMGNVFSRISFDPKKCTWTLVNNGPSVLTTTPYFVRFKGTFLYLSVWTEVPYWERLYLEDPQSGRPNSEYQWYFNMSLIIKKGGYSGIFFTKDPAISTDPYVLTYDDMITHQGFTAVTPKEQYTYQIPVTNNLFIMKLIGNKAS